MLNVLFLLFKTLSAPATEPPGQSIGYVSLSATTTWFAISLPSPRPHKGIDSHAATIELLLRARTL